MLVASAITIRNHSSIWRVLTPLASATSGSTDDRSSSSGRYMSAIRAMLTSPGRRSVPARLNYAINYRGIIIPATRRVCAYRLGCVAEVTAFLTADLTRFGSPARIRP
jgi:hypothetical protein